MWHYLLGGETFGVPTLQVGGRFWRSLRVDDREQLEATRITFDATEPEELTIYMNKSFKIHNDLIWHEHLEFLKPKETF